MMKNILLFFTLLFFVSCSDNGGSVGTPTPKPVELSINSTHPVPAETRQAMTQALLDLFDEVKPKGYSRYLKLSDYIVIIRYDCQPINGVMSWEQYTPGYGVIWQAERVEISNGVIQSFQICNDNIGTMANTTRYGAEHIILYFNDRNEFERTRLHDLNDPSTAHPIIK